MKINFWYKGVLVAAALCIVPAALPAAGGADRPNADMVQAGTGTFPTTASDLLQRVQNDAFRVRDDTDQLSARLRDGFGVGWQSYTNLLERTRTRVNAMDRLLAQLRTNQSEALPWQQQAIERIVPRVVNLSDTTQDAISTFNKDKAHVYMSDLSALSGHMYNEAKSIEQEIGNFQKYADAHQEAHQLRQELGLEKSS